jgi:hypothetical protein
MIGIGLHIGNRVMGGGVDAQAQAHYNRVIADGGVVPAGLSGVNAFFTAVKTIYGTSDITTAISVGVDAHYLGYKLGAGAGATLGQAAQKLYSCAGSSGDVVQTTAASQPLLLAFDGVNKYYQGVTFANGNSCSCPITLTQTDTLEFITKIDLTNYGGYAIGTIDNAVASRAFYAIYTGGSFGLIYGSGLSQSVTASVTTDRYNGWFRVTLEKSGSNSLIKFYKSDEFNITDKNLVTWVQIGSTITGTYAAMPNTPTFLNILSGGQGSNTSFAKVYYAQISETIGGSPLSVFNPNQYNAATSQTQWTSSTGEVWTINTGTANTGYKGVLVDRTIVQGDGVDDLLNATISGSGRFTQYLAVSPFGSIASNEAIAGPWDLGNWRGAIYTSSSSFATYQGGLADGFFGSTITKARLNLVGVVNSSTGTDWQPFINGTDVSNGGLNIGSQNDYTSVGIFARSLGVTFTNSLVNSYILGKQADNSTQRTAIYNYIRSLNNNAF